eukprot:TRINITY_DN81888_c0_g1_i1.p1 TRINITY_DN81888_c0_g1~~TRINITY_DN81888_c0_g1_i1.p1  ORF type:complete len:307 (+),score=64.20 TRINITY_DN81888_c0_g1_i1:72-992(+)
MAAPGEGEPPAGGKPEKTRKRRSSDWEINPEDLTDWSDEPIGQGSTSQVFSAQLLGQLVAVKEIADAEDSTLLAVRREVQVMTRTEHPHVLRFLGITSSRPPLRLYLEYCAGGTLFDLLHNHWEISLNWKQRLQILLDTASAMEYLHGFRKQIIHRDLKSLNIFLLEEVTSEEVMPTIKIADFGFARLLEASQAKDPATMTRCAGSMHWMAPEVYQGEQYSSKADNFSFAIVMYEVICRHMAFEDCEPEAAAENIGAGGRPELIDAPEDTPPALVDLMVRCWSHDPANRPAFTQVHQELVAISAAL